MVRRYGKWVAIVFAAWFVITQPAKAGDLVEWAATSLAAAGGALSTFFSSL
jgi:hypothetical protein